MIKYPMQCPNGHAYDSWFKDSKAYETLLASGLLRCEVCGSTKVVKGICAPRIAKGKSEDQISEQMPVQFEDVGQDFPRVVRAIRDGEEPRRSVCGVATTEDIQQLSEEGFNINVGTVGEVH